MSLPLNSAKLRLGLAMAWFATWLAPACEPSAPDPEPAGGSAGAADGGEVDAGGSSGGTGGSTGGAAGGGSPGGGAAGGGVPIERPSLVTSGRGAYWQVGELEPSREPATITVNSTKVFQTWLGFGGTFNEAGWEALLLLSEGERERALRLLFGASDGANFSWGRLPIGASDYALSRYTLHDTPGDYEMASFSLERDKDYLLPFVKAAQAVKPTIRFWGSPWTPPAWMKDPPELDGTDAGPNGVPPATYEAFMKSEAQDPKVLGAYALYLAKWVEAYEAEGVDIDSIHPQNEPEYSTRYPSCRWQAGLLGRFVGEYLGPLFAERRVGADIWFGTLSSNEPAIYRDQMRGLEGKAEDYVVGVGLQWDTLSRVPELAARGLLVMQTEHKCGNYPFSVPGTPAFNPDMPANDHAYAVESWGHLRDWLKAGVNAYMAWNMVLDSEGKNLDTVLPWPQNALLVVDREAKRLTATPAYFVFRHLSGFVEPQAVRLDVTGGDALAFRNPDGSLTAVLFNSAETANTARVALGPSVYEVEVPARGWATLFTPPPT